MGRPPGGSRLDTDRIPVQENALSTTIMVATHGDDEPTRDALTLGVKLARLLDGDLVLAGVWASPLGQGDGLYEGLIKDPLDREL